MNGYTDKEHQDALAGLAGALEAETVANHIRMALMPLLDNGPSQRVDDLMAEAMSKPEDEQWPLWLISGGTGMHIAIAVNRVAELIDRREAGLHQQEVAVDLLIGNIRCLVSVGTSD